VYVRNQRLNAPQATQQLEVAVGGGAIRVAVRSGDDCLRARVADQVEAWFPDRISLEPGETSYTALAAAGT
jgi:hypothetical protein